MIPIFYVIPGSSNSSKYFASNDSSDTSRKARKSQEAPAEHPRSFDNQVESSLWSMIQHTSEHVMMTYQIHTRYIHTQSAPYPFHSNIDDLKKKIISYLVPWPYLLAM